MSERIRKAREFRSRMSPPEARLWVELKALRSEGFHFRRQAPFGPYFLDFVCFSRRLVVEVDGMHHTLPEQVRRDRIRDAALTRQGFRVLRYPAEAVRINVDGVVAGVRDILKGRSPTRPSGRGPEGVPPHEGEGDA